MEENEQNLMARAVAGDLDAFAHIATRYRSRLEGIGLHLLRCPATAEDVAQETLTRALQEVGHFRGHSRPSTWFHSIAVHVCHHWRRSKRRCRTTSDTRIFERDPRRTPSCAGVLLPVLRRETDTLLKLALDSLTRCQREAFVLHYLESRPHEEVARWLCTTVPGARALCLRARRVLRWRLSAHLLNTE